MLYADDAGIVSRSSEELERMMTVIMTACSAFGLTVSEPKTEIMCLQPQGGGKVSCTTNAVGQVYKQSSLCTWAGLSPQTETLALKQRGVFRGPGRASSGTRWKAMIARVCAYGKVRLLKVEVIEALLCGCITWSPNKPDYDRLRRVHHSMLLRCLGWRKRKRDDYTLLYANVLAKTASESIEAIVRKQRI